MSELVYIMSTGILYSRGGQYLMTASLDECANEYLDIVICVQEHY